MILFHKVFWSDCQHSLFMCSYVTNMNLCVMFSKIYTSWNGTKWALIDNNFITIRYGFYLKYFSYISLKSVNKNQTKRILYLRNFLRQKTPIVLDTDIKRIQRMDEGILKIVKIYLKNIWKCKIKVKDLIYFHKVNIFLHFTEKPLSLSKTNVNKLF